jgi:hypothetical protein
MYTRLDQAHRAVPVILAVNTMAGVVLLLVCDLWPTLFPVRFHGYIEAFPLAMIAVSYLVYQSVHRPSAKEWLKAILLAIAFFFWAANQFWTNPHQATIFNDIAIALFVLDVFLVIVGWPAASPDESFAESYSQSDSQPIRPDRTNKI